MALKIDEIRNERLTGSREKMKGERRREREREKVNEREGKKEKRKRRKELGGFLLWENRQASCGFDNLKVESCTFVLNNERVYI